MKKKLIAIGNSLGLIIERPILDLLDIDRDTVLEVKTDGDGLIIRPLRENHVRRVQKSMQKMIEVHDKTLAKLAE